MNRILTHLILMFACCLLTACIVESVGVTTAIDEEGMPVSPDVAPAATPLPH